MATSGSMQAPLLDSKDEDDKETEAAMAQLLQGKKIEKRLAKIQKKASDMKTTLQDQNAGKPDPEDDANAPMDEEVLKEFNLNWFDTSKQSAQRLQEESSAQMRLNNIILVVIFVVTVAVVMPALWFLLLGGGHAAGDGQGLQAVKAAVAGHGAQIEALENSVKSVNHRMGVEKSHRVAALESDQTSITHLDGRVHSIESKIKDGVCTYCSSCGGNWPVYTGESEEKFKESKKHGAECSEGFLSVSGMKTTQLCCSRV